MKIVTRFAPSPTGYLHIGGARTALFNWLFAKHHGGTFLLRIEDTDRARSTQPAIDAIIDSLTWLELNWDGEITYQFSRAARHAEVARQLLAEGKAYYCYASPEELEAMRAQQREKGLPLRYDGRWRDRNSSDAPAGIAPVIRLKAPQSGETIVNDQVQGDVTVANAQLDDMVLLRADGTPTYMLSVVVDDHDMDITHVIRGDDHLTNTFRQLQIYRAMGWPTPIFAHIPLIHGPDGAKLSKRHGATGVESYRDMGYLPEAMRNYLLRLGWAHGDDEIINTADAIQWFDLPGIGRSPSRLDFAKLDHLNGHYIRETGNDRLLSLLMPFLTARLGATPSATGLDRLVRGMEGLKARAKTLVELADHSLFYLRTRPIPMDDKAKTLLNDDARKALVELRQDLEGLAIWSAETTEAAVRAYVERKGLKLGQIAQPLRASLCGSTVSPGIFDVIAVLGKDETLGRIDDAVR